MDEPDKVFTRALDHELEKIGTFYQLKELEIYGELETLLRDEAEYEEEQEGLEDGDGTRPRTSGTGGTGGRDRSGSIFQKLKFGRPRRTSTMSRSIPDHHQDSDSDDDADEGTALRSSKSRDGQFPRHDDVETSPVEGPNLRRRRTSTIMDDYNDMTFSALYDSGITIKKRIISLYVSLCELRSFIQLNKTGFTKVLKKYDKILDRHLKSTYIEEHVEKAHVFQQSTMNSLGKHIDDMESAYSRISTKGDIAEAKRELRLHLREHVVWERNTVWREMIGIERKAQAANMGVRGTMLGRDDPQQARRQGDAGATAETKIVKTPLGRYRCPSWLFSGSFFALLCSFVVFLVLLLVPIMKKPEQQNCLAMVAFVSLLWATEVGRSLSQYNDHADLVYLGDTTVRNISSRPLSLRRPPCRPFRRETSQTP